MKSRPIDLLTRSGLVIELNYCPVCKRECRGGIRRKSGHCPVCGSRLTKLTDDELNILQQEKSPEESG